MPRTARHAPKGFVYHALNRAVARLPLFSQDSDYEAFEHVMLEAHAKFPVQILSYCVMPNHWHFVLRPGDDGELTAFLRWLANTHTMRWHAYHRTAGTGHLYQGRFKAFPVADDEHFYAVARYVERNALRAGLVRKAEAWRWSSLWRREFGAAEARSLLARWPVPLPRGWVAHVNTPQTEAELAGVRNSVRRGTPFGEDDWRQSVAERLNLQATLRPRGRPRKSLREAVD
jgi:putative transposase